METGHPKILGSLRGCRRIGKKVLQLRTNVKRAGVLFEGVAIHDRRKVF